MSITAISTPKLNQRQRMTLKSLTSNNLPNVVVQDTLEAQAILWNQTLGFIKSMSLKCAVELRIPDAIHRHGMPATISDLLSSLSIPEAKSRPLHILMRILSKEGIFKSHITLSCEDAFDLTHVSRLLLTTTSFLHSPNFSPLILMILNHHLVDAHHQLSQWFYEPDMTTMPFAMAHGKTFWDLTEELPQFNDLFNTAMESDSGLVAKVMTKIGADVFQGIGTLVDVGGGTGVMAAALVEAFPGLKCTVFDLPHVIATAQKMDGIQFVGGDMFLEVPPTDVILLKWILHDWNDEDCVNILQRCKEAIPPKEKGGKVIIIDMVVGAGFFTQTLLETQFLFDLLMMTLCRGKERNEGEWRKIFVDAGFSDYKIISSVDLRSIIEVYP